MAPDGPRPMRTTHTRHRIARSRETVTFTTESRDVGVDATTGRHTTTKTAEATKVPCIITRIAQPGADRIANSDRVLNQRNLSMRVLLTSPTPVVGDVCTVVQARDPALVGAVGKVTGVGVAGRSYRRVEVEILA